MKTTRYFRAFTLVELFVTIAMIAILAALLLPALNAARGKGQSSVCAGKLKQIALANHMYANDCDEFFVPYRESEDDSDQSAGAYWFGNRVDSVYDITESPLLGTYYGHTAKLMVCPTAELGTTDITRTPYGGGYGYNGTWFGRYRLSDTELWAIRRTAMRALARTVMFGDCGGSGKRSTSYASIRVTPLMYCKVKPLSSGERYDNALSGTMHFRHLLRANCAWGDGHVSPEPVGTINSHTHAAEGPVGYLRAENIDVYNPIRTSDEIR